MTQQKYLFQPMKLKKIDSSEIEGKSDFTSIKPNESKINKLTNLKKPILPSSTLVPTYSIDLKMSDFDQH